MTRSLPAALCAFSALGLAAFAAQADDTRTADRESRRAAILEEFDMDGDGRLTGDERSAAREARDARRAENGRDGERRDPRGMNRGDSGRAGRSGGHGGRDRGSRGGGRH